MKIFKYAMLIALTIFTTPLLAMNKQDTAKVTEVFEKSIRKRKAKLGKAPGVKVFGSELNPISLAIEKKAILDIVEWCPTAEALTNLLNTYPPLKEYIRGMLKVTVEKSNQQGVSNIATFVAYRDENQSNEGAPVKGKPLFFLKISIYPYKEILERLNALQKGPVGNFNLKALSNREFPIIVLQEMFFIYRGNNAKYYAVEVMHLAHGEQVSSIMRNSSDEAIKNCMEKVGKALGLFHVYFMNYHNSNDPSQWTTMLHGDFHAGNIFFDAKSGRVYFIDNESMSENNDIKFDLDLFSTSHSFLKSYLSAYPLDKREFMTAYLKKLNFSVEINPTQELKEIVQEKKKIKIDSQLTLVQKTEKLNALRARERELKKQCETQGTCSVE